MIQFWEVLGRAALDEQFLAELLGDPNLQAIDTGADLKTFNDRVNGYGPSFRFRLSRFEVVELFRLLQYGDVITSLRGLGRLWASTAPPVSIERSRIIGLLCVDMELRHALEGLNERAVFETTLRETYHFDGLTAAESAKLFDLLRKGAGGEPSEASRLWDNIHDKWDKSCLPALKFDPAYIHPRDGSVWAPGTRAAGSGH